jgi:hypothetical protein
MLAVPTLTPVSSPAALTLTTPGAEEMKVEPVVRSSVEESL